MSVTEALDCARAAGVSVTLKGENLLLEAVTEPPSSVVNALERQKPAIVDLLRAAQCGRTIEYWRACFEKHRARLESRSAAFECCVVEWLSHHPAPSPAGRCAWCGKLESSSAVVLPFGIEPGTHTWLHAECWAAWHHTRKTDAIVALTAIGLPNWRDDESQA